MTVAVTAVAMASVGAGCCLRGRVESPCEGEPRLAVVDGPMGGGGKGGVVIRLNLNTLYAEVYLCMHACVYARTVKIPMTGG